MSTPADESRQPPEELPERSRRHSPEAMTGLRPRADDARATLFVWAVEEEDRGGRLLPLEARSRATREALADDSKPERLRWLGARARALLSPLELTFPRLRSLLRHSDPAAGWTLPMVVGAFILGMATNGTLLSERPINVLAAPLMGLVLWNVVICALSLLSLLIGWSLPGRSWRNAGGDGLRPGDAGGDILGRRAGRGGPYGPWLSFFERFVLRLVETVGDGRRGRSSSAGSGSIDSGKADSGAAPTGADLPSLQRASIRRFLAAWLPASRPLALARIRRLLHLAALAAVGGALFGLYVRGIAFEYKATWESTFLDVAATDLVLGIALGPAAWVLGGSVPSVANLAAAGVDAGANAGPWIHLWAVTALLFVGLPRLFLAGIEGLALLRHRRALSIELPSSYLRRLRASASTATHDVQVLPYSHRPSEGAARALRGLLLDLSGARSRIRLAEPVAYGAPAPAEFPGRLRVALFSLVQTPELEVHGELLRHLKDDRADGQGLLVLVDESAFRKRSSDESALLEERLETRRRAWRRVVVDAGLEPSFVDLAAVESGGGALLEQLAKDVWPPETRLMEGA